MSLPFASFSFSPPTPSSLPLPLHTTGVDYVKAHGTITGPNEVSCQLVDGGESKIKAKNILIATGGWVGQDGILVVCERDS